MRIALRTLPYSMLHYVRAVSSITTVVFGADDSLQLIMLWFSCDYIVFQYNYHRWYTTCSLSLFLYVSSRGDTSGACSTRGGGCTSDCTRRWYTEHVKHVKNTHFEVDSWQVSDLNGLWFVGQVCHGELNGSVLATNYIRFLLFVV